MRACFAGVVRRLGRRPCFFVIGESFGSAECPHRHRQVRSQHHVQVDSIAGLIRALTIGSHHMRVNRRTARDFGPRSAVEAAGPPTEPIKLTPSAFRNAPRIFSPHYLQNSDDYLHTSLLHSGTISAPCSCSA